MQYAPCPLLTIALQQISLLGFRVARLATSQRRPTMVSRTEAGCPYCFTIDGQTLQDQTVTVRDRDIGAQDRNAIDRVVDFLTDKLGL